MGRAEQYRHYATECIRLAQQMQNSTEKELLLHMAETWHRLAARAESMGDRNAAGEPQ